MSKAKSATKKKAEVKAPMYDVILTPVITEKSQLGVEFNKVTFKVATDATKKSVKWAVEGLFGVDVDKVNVINVKGKTKRFRGRPGKRKDQRKAIVTLKDGQTIDIESGLKG